MRVSNVSKIILICSFILIFFYFYVLRFMNLDTPPYANIPISEAQTVTHQSELSTNSQEMTLVAVACGDRLRETLTMIKSALVMSKEKLKIYVFAGDQLMEGFREKLAEWQSFTNQAFSYRIMSLTFPSRYQEEWRRLFKPCASQRLFLPNVLHNVDSILYVDTDTLFLVPVETVWAHFDRMNSSQMAALAPEHEDPNVGWYNRFAKHPYYGRMGVNSGVMLMNLTRMRQFQWLKYLNPIYARYKLQITWGDQDIINIIFHYHPDKLYTYSCRYNYRPDHCMYMSVCKEAEEEGVAVVHGSRGFFHSQRQPAFQALYDTFDELQLGSDMLQQFYQPLVERFESVKDTNCGMVRDLFLKSLRKHLDIEDPHQ